MVCLVRGVQEEDETGCDGVDEDRPCGAELLVRVLLEDAEDLVRVFEAGLRVS